MLRRLTLMVTLSGALMSVASAADVGIRRPIYKARPPVPVAGSAISFYGGVHGGFGWSDISSSTALGTLQSLNPNGFLGGGQFGANYQIDKWVIGAEGDFSLASIQDSASGTILGVPFTIGVRHLWFATLAGRVGYAYDRMLFYAKGGAAWTRFKADVDAPTLGAASAEQTRLGWMVGAGIEQAVTDAVSIKLEYNYLDFGTSDHTVFTNDGLTVTPVDIKLNAQLVKLGVNYRFNAAR